jgi:hypothetical protein
MLHSSNFFSVYQVKFYQPNILEFGMGKIHIKQILARNLKAAMERHYGGEVNQSQLSRDTKGVVSPKTISNYLAANRLPAGDLEVESAHSATISNLAAISDVLGVEVWQLIHPNPDLARRQQELYERMQSEFGVGDYQGPVAVTPETESRVHHLKQAAPGLREQLIAMFDSANSQQQKSIVSFARNVMKRFKGAGDSGAQSREGD